jgi:hypothetical protein
MINLYFKWFLNRACKVTHFPEQRKEKPMFFLLAPLAPVAPARKKNLT